MKSITRLLFATTALCYGSDIDNSRRDLASLAEKWNITEPAFNYAGLGFTLEYGVNRYILDNSQMNMIQWSIWDEDCKPSDGTDGHLVWDHTLDSSGPGNYAGFKTVNGTSDRLLTSYPQITTESTPEGSYTIGIQIDTEKITSNTNLYKEFTVDNQLTAEVRFCNRFELWTPSRFPGGSTNPSPIEVNFLETIVTLTVDLTDGFEIGSIAVEPKDRVVRTANQVYQVVGFLCRSDNVPLSNAELGRARNQGEVVRVCVEPEPEALQDGIKMRSIDSFAFTRDTFRQVAVVEGAPAPNLLTTYDPTICRGARTCWFETILFASFYSSVGAVDGAGIASMQFGTAQSRRRRLRSGDRELQEDEAAAAAEFELEFDVQPVERTFSSAPNRVGSKSIVFLTTVLAGLTYLIV